MITRRSLLSLMVVVPLALVPPWEWPRAAKPPEAAPPPRETRCACGRQRINDGVAGVGITNPHNGEVEHHFPNRCSRLWQWGTPYELVLGYRRRA